MPQKKRQHVQRKCETQSAPLSSNISLTAVAPARTPPVYLKFPRARPLPLYARLYPPSLAIFLPSLSVNRTKPRNKQIQPAKERNAGYFLDQSESPKYSSIFNRKKEKEKRKKIHVRCRPIESPSVGNGDSRRVHLLLVPSHARRPPLRRPHPIWPPPQPPVGRVPHP